MSPVSRPSRSQFSGSLPDGSLPDEHDTWPEERASLAGHQPALSGVAEAVAAVESGLAFLAVADAASLPGETLADCVRALSLAASPFVAARSRFLSAFNAQEACVADGHPTTKSWLRWQTRQTSSAAGADVAWMRRLAAHPHVADALAGRAISVSWARQICDWTDQLPPKFRADADQILLAAAAGGADLADLAGLARQIYDRTIPPEPDDGPPGPDDGYEDRSLQLDQHYRGAGHLTGNLTPDCAAALAAVLDSLGKKAGPEDDRTQAQRSHDALAEAARLLLGTGTLPDVAGQPAQMLVHATLDQILGSLSHSDFSHGDAPAATGPGDADSTGQSDAADVPSVPDVPDAAAGDATGATTAGGTGARGDAGAFAAGRAAGDGEPGWLTSRAAAEAHACDARIATVVTGQLDPVIVATAVRCFLASREPAATAAASYDRLAATLARYATAMLSGPAGLAAALRSGLPGPLGAGVSLPLDITSPTATVPPHLRRAVTARDRHCAFPGCHQKPARCQVHHLIPRSRGGPTTLTNLVLLCAFHHLHLIHRRGWTLVLNADGTTAATSPDRRKVWPSHGPPARTAA